VVYFKREVYERALTELSDHLDPLRPLPHPESLTVTGSKT